MITQFIVGDKVRYEKVQFEIFNVTINQQDANVTGGTILFTRTISIIGQQSRYNSGLHR